jgi:hypothetical protein
MRAQAYLHLYEPEADYRAAGLEVSLLKALAQDMVEIDAAQIRRLEPTPATTGFAMTAMNDGLRCAGMVQLAGLAKPANPACHAYLTGTARRCLPELPALVFAYGHQHVVRSCGGVTGSMIAAIAANEPSPVDLPAFSSECF